MRTPFIAGNWKMFKTVHEAVAFVNDLRAAVKDVTGVHIVVGPPFTALKAAADAARDSKIAVSAQDMHWEREGAFTGEVSAAMIKEAGARFAIIGHSERRRLFGETNAIVTPPHHPQRRLPARARVARRGRRRGAGAGAARRGARGGRAPLSSSPARDLTSPGR